MDIFENSFFRINRHNLEKINHIFEIIWLNSVDTNQRKYTIRMKSIVLKSEYSRDYQMFKVNELSIVSFRNSKQLETGLK